jgi:hypothetical protein
MGYVCSSMTQLPFQRWESLPPGGLGGGSVGIVTVEPKRRTLYVVRYCRILA